MGKKRVRKLRHAVTEKMLAKQGKKKATKKKAAKKKATKKKLKIVK